MQSSRDQAVSSPPIPSPEERRSEERISLPSSRQGIVSVKDGLQVGPNDVLCGRNKDSFNHPGNKLFRDAITFSVDQYNKAESRAGKSKVVLSILEAIRSKGGRFLKLDSSSKEWQSLSDQQAKEKIAHAVRDMEGRKFGRKPLAQVLKKSFSQTNLDSSHHSATFDMLSTRSLPEISHEGPFSYDVSPANVNNDFYERLQDATRLLNNAGLGQSPADQQAAYLSLRNTSAPVGGMTHPQETTIASEASIAWPPLSSTMDVSRASANFSLGQSANDSLQPIDFSIAPSESQNAAMHQPQPSTMNYPSGFLLNDQSSSRPSLMASSSLSDVGSSLQHISQESFQSSYDFNPQPLELENYPSRRLRREDGSEHSMTRLEEESNSSPSSSSASDPFLETINTVLGPLNPEDHNNERYPMEE
mmetsp:Transcript_2828/g.7937  ORF Transcript_2828/g.7937 Transcript_2828/m.7937 type:complete len:418 (-) Transcript_2828:183-1436(-)|eukprot:CAMPEP_0168742528 /NCGR_PEP_ID=MMETSP0724-20121128/13082_1 /TAXON_ID=265536 /ORGANISM="Amphiprora sp., Strain CCMP467" /LENGTH=417 /DNA_ID=CAMNT_0008790079 /DNA_START=97 /DNA_END=1350 /DNA_ORIENTATION=-